MEGKRMKLKVPNRPGQYELGGTKVTVFDNEIIIETPTRERKEPGSKRTYAPEKAAASDDGNMSILSSLSRLQDRFGKK